MPPNPPFKGGEEKPDKVGIYFVSPFSLPKLALRINVLEFLGTAIEFGGSKNPKSPLYKNCTFFWNINVSRKSFLKAEIESKHVGTKHSGF